MERFSTLQLLAWLLCGILSPDVESVQNQEGACLRSQFRCSDGGCVDHSWRCDHTEDCKDGSDEENCEENECEVNNGGCSHHCEDLPHGFVCDCPPGMRLVHDTDCEEVDPCLDADVCDQKCVYSNSSFTCECNYGYMKSSARGRCLAPDDAAVVIFSSREGIMMMKPDGSEQKNLTNGTGISGALTSLVAQNSLFWADTEHVHIYRLVLDAADEEPSVIFSGVGGIVGLAVDWIHQVLYWTSKSTRAIHAAALNRTNHAPLISALSSPTGVAVQPLVGFLFWADAGVSPRIERSDLNGHHRRTLVSSAIQNPVAITLDLPRGLLYWADSHMKTVSRVTYYGLSRKTVLESNGYLDQPFGLAVFESDVYWSDRSTGTICRADKHNEKLLKITRVSGASSLAGLLIHHSLLQPTDMTTSPIELSNVEGVYRSDSASTFIWIFCLIVLPCVLYATLFRCRWAGQFSSSRSPLYREPIMKESQDPLVPSGDNEELASRENTFHV